MSTHVRSSIYTILSRLDYDFDNYQGIIDLTEYNTFSPRFG